MCSVAGGDNFLLTFKKYSSIDLIELIIILKMRGLFLFRVSHCSLNLQIIDVVVLRSGFIVSRFSRVHHDACVQNVFHIVILFIARAVSG